MLEHYILDERGEVREVPLLEWARWLERRHEVLFVAQTIFDDPMPAPATAEHAGALLAMMAFLDYQVHHVSGTELVHAEAHGERRILVSTIFIGIDQRLLPLGGAPLLWETRVFGGPLDGDRDRYSSHAEAVAGHAAICTKVRAALQAARAAP